MIKIFLIGMLACFIGLMLWLALQSGDFLSWGGWRWAGVVINGSVGGAIGWYARGQHERGKRMRNSARPQ